MPYLEKRSISLSGHATSVALEPAFWAELEGMAHAGGQSVGRLIAAIDAARGGRPLASSCRLSVLTALRDKARGPETDVSERG